MSVNDLDYLGSAMAVLRRRTGKLQKDVSSETGMSRSQVSRYERGHDTPNLATLVRYLVTVGGDFRDLHEAIQEVKVAAGDLDLNRPLRLAELEKALMDRLPSAPDLRKSLYQVLEPLYLEVEDIKQTLTDIMIRLEDS